MRHTLLTCAVGERSTEDVSPNPHVRTAAHHPYTLPVHPARTDYCMLCAHVRINHNLWPGGFARLTLSASAAGSPPCILCPRAPPPFPARPPFPFYTHTLLSTGTRECGSVAWVASSSTQMGKEMAWGGMKLINHTLVNIGKSSILLINCHEHSTTCADVEGVRAGRCNGGTCAQVRYSQRPLHTWHPQTAASNPLANPLATPNPTPTCMRASPHPMHVAATTRARDRMSRAAPSSSSRAWGVRSS